MFVHELGRVITYLYKIMAQYGVCSSVISGRQGASLHEALEPSRCLIATLPIDLCIALIMIIHLGKYNVNI